MRTDIVSADGVRVYRRILDRLDSAGVPVLVGGSFALSRYTGIERHSKDFDLFVRPADLGRVEEAVAEDPLLSFEHFSPHWLSKIHWDGEVVDVIFSSGNGVAEVDDAWFVHAGEGEVFGRSVRFCPPEEMIWSKAFIMERERFDGADVLHLLHARASSLDWERLLERFGRHWRVLLAHLVLFEFVYPHRRGTLPKEVVEELGRRLLEEQGEAPEAEEICRGTLLSRSQYLPDVEEWGYRDGRLAPEGSMDQDEIEHWTERAREDGTA